MRRPDLWNLNDAVVTSTKTRSKMQRTLGPAGRKFRAFARPSIDLLRLIGHYEIGAIRADASGQFLERARDVFGDLIVL